jgi:lysophospholipase L1-like esterase
MSDNSTESSVVSPATVGLQRLEETLVEAIGKVVQDQENRTLAIEKKLDQLTELTLKSLRDNEDKLNQTLKMMTESLGNNEEKLNQTLKMMTNLKLESKERKPDETDVKSDERRPRDAQKHSSLVTDESAQHIPCVLLIGTSNFKKIREQKLTSFANVSKTLAYTLDETLNYVESFNGNSPDVIVLHPFTNDIKIMEPKQCLDQLEHIIHVIKEKWPNSKLIVSLETARLDDIRYHTNSQILNMLVRQHFYSSNIRCVDHSYLMSNGEPIADMLHTDGVHLNDRGTSQLAANIKKAVHDALGVYVQPPRNRSRSRGRHFHGVRK